MLILLDRDGVINVDVPPHGVTSLDALTIYAYAGEAIRMLRHAGFRVAVVTNQSAIGKGLLSDAGLHEIHAAIRATLLAQAGAIIDAFYYCPDHPDHPTYRRKPADGMLREACAEFGVNPAHTPMVGDDVRDVQAAQSLGCPPYLVMTGKGVQTKECLSTRIDSVTICQDLLDASRHIVLKFARENL